MSTETDTSLHNLTQRFQLYFQRDIAQEAARSLVDGTEIQFRIKGADGNPVESFVFLKSKGINQIQAGDATDPQVVFTLTPLAAEGILADPSNDIPSIGINIVKLIVSSDNDRKVSVQVKAGFLSLFSKGYFGVLLVGGAHFAAYLATIGLDGMVAIKTALKKMKE